MAKTKRKGKKKRGGGRSKVEKVMSEYKHHQLHSGSKNGPLVTSRRQAIAIALSEQRKYGGSGGAVRKRHTTHRRKSGAKRVKGRRKKRVSRRRS